MVLEETLILNGIDDVQDLTQTFRDAGIKVRIRQAMDVDNTAILTGKIQDFRALFTGEIEDGVEPDLQEMYEQALTTIEETAEIITAIMDKYPPGEVLEQSREERFLQQFEKGIRKGEDIDTIITKTAKEISEWLRIYSLLCLNDLGEMTDDGAMVMQRHADPDELLIILPVELVDEIGEECYIEHGIWTKIAITTIPVCHVTFGADAIAKLDPDEINDLVEYLNPDIDTYETFRENYTTKKIILEWILDCISDHGTATAMQILEVVSKSPICTREFGAEITIATDLEYVKEALSDMQKAKLIKKTGRAFKVV
ncbi:MAG: hypothetical protein U9N40_00490 [Euryarchaeota archaeon]|nr:hypothetical protein [Euryarchaeota archaeon]